MKVRQSLDVVALRAPLITHPQVEVVVDASRVPASEPIKGMSDRVT